MHPDTDVQPRPGESVVDIWTQDEDQLYALPRTSQGAILILGESLGPDVHGG